MVIDKYVEALSTGKLNGYGYIDSLTNAQVDILCGIASAVSKTSIIDREGLKVFSRTATETDRIFDHYIENVMLAYTDLVAAA